MHRRGPFRLPLSLAVVVGATACGFVGVESLEGGDSKSDPLGDGDGDVRVGDGDRGGDGDGDLGGAPGDGDRTGDGDGIGDGDASAGDGDGDRGTGSVSGDGDGDGDTGGVAGDGGSSAGGTPGDGDGDLGTGSASGDGDGDLGAGGSDATGGSGGMIIGDGDGDGDGDLGAGGSGGSGGTDGTGGTDGAGGTDGTGGSGGSSSDLCKQPGSNHFSFSSASSFINDSPSIGQWGLDQEFTDNSGSGQWDPAKGHWDAGAIRLRIVDPWGNWDRQVLFPYTAFNSANFTDTEFAVLLYVESGRDVEANVFAQTHEYAWAHGEPFSLPEGQWTCLSLDLGEPYFKESGFDVTDVAKVGIEISRQESSNLNNDIIVYVDDFSY